MMKALPQTVKSLGSRFIPPVHKIGNVLRGSVCVTPVFAGETTDASNLADRRTSRREIRRHRL